MITIIGIGLNLNFIGFGFGLITTNFTLDMARRSVRTSAENTNLFFSPVEPGQSGSKAFDAVDGKDDEDMALASRRVPVLQCFWEPGVGTARHSIPCPKHILVCTRLACCFQL